MRSATRNIRTKLESGSPVFGVTIQLPSPDAVEIAGYVGLDYVWLDAEHGTLDLGDINQLVRAADAVGIDTIVRIPEHSASFIQRVLDIGATGVLAPHIRTVEDARAIVAAASYAPEGIRGACPSVRSVGHVTTDWAADLRRAREQTIVLGLIEDVQGVENVEAIAADSQLDGLAFGPFDLAMELGFDGDVRHATIGDMNARVRAAARNAGIEYLAIPGWDAGNVESLLREGVRMFNLNGDRGALFTTFSAELAQARQALAAVNEVSQS